MVDLSVFGGDSCWFSCFGFISVSWILLVVLEIIEYGYGYFMVLSGSDQVLVVLGGSLWVWMVIGDSLWFLLVL